MSLNIKNPRVHQLAREAAQITGESQTRAVEIALERLIAEGRHDPDEAARQKRIDLLWADIDATPASPSHRAETRRLMDAMYDDLGLPR